MKSTFLIFFSIITLCATNSCSKEEVKDCEANKYATVQISNSSSNPYDIWIDNVYKLRLNGNSISSPIKVSEGNNRTFYAKQASGYLLTPTEKTSNFSVLRCNSYSWQIP
jgi:hypothetical protein